MGNDQVVKAPASTPDLRVEELAYIDSYDAVADKMYALVVYKETKTSGQWVLRIKSAVTAGTVFDPEATALKNALRKAAGQGQKYLVWGFNLQPKEGDPRLVENRVLIDGEGNPTALEVHLITRNADNSPKDEQVATVPWPAGSGEPKKTEQAVTAPASSPHMQVEQLAYIDSYDAVVDKMYALVIYKETKTPGSWVLRIKSANTAGAAFDPEATALKNALRKAAGQGDKYLVWGFNLQPKEGDPRLVENRILVDGDGNPTALEVHLVTRNADSSAKDEQVATVPWPA